MWVQIFDCAGDRPIIAFNTNPQTSPVGYALHTADTPVIAEDLTATSSAPKRPQVKGFSRLKSAILASAGSTLAVLGARSLGVMQPWKLSMFDRLINQRQAEPIDNRLLVVEITDKDVEKYNYPQTDATIARAIDKLQQFQPLAIGLNIHRNSPREPGRKK